MPSTEQTTHLIETKPASQTRKKQQIYQKYFREISKISFKNVVFSDQSDTSNRAYDAFNREFYVFIKKPSLINNSQIEF